MAALDFPVGSTVGQTYTVGGVVWVWDGAKWVGGTAGTGYAPLANPVFTGDPQAPTANPGDADASIASTAFVAAAVAPALHNIGRNLIHNPLFNIAQRGAGPFTALNAYTADRWVIGGSTDTVQFTRNAAADGDRAAVGDEAITYVLTNGFTGNAAVGAFNEIVQRVEGVRRLSGKTVTLSFWAIASAALKIGVAYSQFFGTGGSPSAIVNVTGQAVTAGTAWARYSVTIALPSAAGKTFGTNGDDFTYVRLCYSSGATNSAFFGGVGVQSGTINIWGVQLEVGSVATPLEKPDPRYDLSNCQRFYQSVAFQHGGYTTGGALLAQSFILPTMRSTPTITPNVAGATNVSGPSFLADSPGSVRLNYTAIATGGTEIHGSFFVSADL